MEAMLMNGKEKHEVFDWSDTVSMSQSEFVYFFSVAAPVIWNTLPKPL